MYLFQPSKYIISSDNDRQEEVLNEKAFVCYVQSILSKQGRPTAEVQVLKRLTVFWEENAFWEELSYWKWMETVLGEEAKVFNWLLKQIETTANHTVEI